MDDQSGKQWETSGYCVYKQRYISRRQSLSSPVCYVTHSSDCITVKDYDGYCFRNKTKANHLFYMDDLKLFGKAKAPPHGSE